MRISSMAKPDSPSLATPSTPTPSPATSIPAMNSSRPKPRYAYADIPISTMRIHVVVGSVMPSQPNLAPPCLA